jgi:RNA polymerase sigma factor (sigma-70 family)
MQATAILPSARPRIVPWSRMGDESLASRAAAGNEAAFTALYERYHGPLLGYCRSILLDVEDAHDATQSALENALRALPRREPGRPLRPWLYRIAHNEAITILRRRRPHADVDPATVLTVPGPEVDAEQRTRLSQLVDDLRMLPERQRGALVMRELSGLSYDEIGGALGVSNEAARRAVFDARTALHDAVDGRATACVSVRRSLSDGDRRHLRARGVRAHLRSCDDCATFELAMGARQTDLHALGPWLGGAGALGLIGLGAGGAGTGAGTLVAAGGGAGATAGSGGLTWAGLPVAVKGLAVAAVVATSGTAAVEIPKVTAHHSPAPQRQEAAGPALAPPAISPLHDALRERALAQAQAARRERAARRADPARVQTGGGSAARVAAHGSHATPSAPAAAAPAAGTTAPVTAQPAPAVTSQQPSARPAPAVAKTPQQVAADKLQRVRDQMLAAFQNAQTVAASGAQGALQTASSMVQSTLGAVRPMIERILASVGLSLPSSSAASPPPASGPTIANVLAPAQSLLGGIEALLARMFGSR